MLEYHLYFSEKVVNYFVRGLILFDNIENDSSFSPFLTFWNNHLFSFPDLLFYLFYVSAKEIVRIDGYSVKSSDVAISFESRKERPHGLLVSGFIVLFLAVYPLHFLLLDSMPLIPLISHMVLISMKMPHNKYEIC